MFSLTIVSTYWQHLSSLYFYIWWGWYEIQCTTCVPVSVCLLVRLFDSLCVGLSGCPFIHLSVSVFICSMLAVLWIFVRLRLEVSSYRFWLSINSYGCQLISVFHLTWREALFGNVNYEHSTIKNQKMTRKSMDRVNSNSFWDFKKSGYRYGKKGMASKKIPMFNLEPPVSIWWWQKCLNSPHKWAVS